MANALARKFTVQTTTDLTLTGGWLTLNGLTDFDPGYSGHTEDATSYSTNGLPAVEVTGYDFAPSGTFFRILTGVYDPAQEVIRLASSLNFGSAARHGLRWFDKNGGPETGQAVVIPTWKRGNTGATQLETIQVTWQVTDGTASLNFTNPGTAATVPLVVSASPSGQGAGKILTLTGASFLGTTGITVGGVAVAAGAFTVQSDSLITLVVPTGTAGSAPIIVTNSVGAGVAFAYTRTT